MKILCKKGSGLTIESGQAVKRIAKHLSKNLNGVYKFVSSANTCDVYFLIYYQVPYLQRIPGKQKEGYNDLHEMKIDLNITTYQNKVRVNLIEITPEERTIGFDVYKPELIQDDIILAREMIWEKVVKRITTAYKDYDFVF